MEIITIGGPDLPRVLYADKVEPATLQPSYIILDECRTISLAVVVAIIPARR